MSQMKMNASFRTGVIDWKCFWTGTSPSNQTKSLVQTRKQISQSPNYDTSTPLFIPIYYMNILPKIPAFYWKIATYNIKKITHAQI